MSASEGVGGAGRPRGVSRRGVLTRAAAVGVGIVGAGSLAACAFDGGSTDPVSTGPVTVPVDKVPVGGATIVGAVVVSQPTAGQFKAFSAICTHEQCLVSRVQGNVVQCPCHLSTFSITDGSVQGGPAPRPLHPRDVTVDGTTLTVT
ncbi:MAG TPA: Rieske 2Fe-2S domain-containing protein [Micromonosporaceae bacterium]